MRKVFKEFVLKCQVCDQIHTQGTVGLLQPIQPHLSFGRIIMAFMVIQPVFKRNTTIVV